MATITLNNLESGNTLICFTDVPNILKVSDSTGGTKANLTLSFSGDLSAVVTGDGQFYITVMGETITNVLNYNNAANKSFYISSSLASTAASVARALRNCPTIAANFIVENNVNGDVVITAREYGSILGNDSSRTNIPDTYLEIGGQDGSAYSDLNGAMIMVDVYENYDNYVTTLEKNWYNGECAFNLSPVLTTISKHGETTLYNYRVSSMKNGVYSVLETSDNHYATVGYKCNQSANYFTSSGLNVALNVSRGESKGTTNNTILYLYENVIPISVYANNIGGMGVQIDYLDGAYNIIHTYSSTWRKPWQNSILYDLTYTLEQPFFGQATYIDLTLSTFKYRFTVIKPFKANEYHQRIYWRNCYGGIQFFDFTGQKSETRNLEVMTYQKNIFDYYDASRNELEKIYDNDVEYEVTLKSHLMEKDGIYVFNDLMQSSDVWTTVNGQEYGIIINSVSVEEQNQNDIFVATVKFKYSQKSSLV